VRRRAEIWMAAVCAVHNKSCWLSNISDHNLFAQ
jgi:hypothetical protein